MDFKKCITLSEEKIYSSRSGLSRIYEIGHVKMNLDLLQSISVQVDRYGVEITPHVKYRIKVQIDCLDGKNIQIESEINLDERQRNV